MIDVIYHEDHLAVVNKPPGLLMHPSPMARDAKTSLVTELKEQFQTDIYLVHRLDRKTSGAVVIAFDKKTAKLLTEDFKQHKVNKTYLAIVRGYLMEACVVTKPLLDDRLVLQEAETHFTPLKYAELPFSAGKYPTTRITLVQAEPKTGRMHQIRKHLAHLRHYIISDKPHGDCKVNKAVEQHLGIKNMMLHARRIQFRHPITHSNLEIEAPFFEEFDVLLNCL